MKELNLVQNTKEWEEYRRSRLGASDANVIMGLSEYKTAFQLYNDKINQVKTVDSIPNYVQNKGHKFEKKARNTWEIISGKDYPPLIVISDEFPYLMASLDGFNAEDNTCWECKYVGKDIFNFVKKKKECIPQYFPQIQQQLLLTGASKCVLFVIREDEENFEFAHIEVLPDLDYMKNKLIPTMAKFWKMLQDKTPPPLTEDDVLDLSDNDILVGLLAQYKEVTDRYKKEEIAKKDLTDRIFKIAKHPRNICHGIKITTSKSSSKEEIDYETLLQDLKIVIDKKYITIKRGSSKKLITFPKELENEEIK